MGRGILDILYWNMHSAYLKNERDRARMFLNLLQKEVNGDEAKLLSGLESETGKKQVERFNIISSNIKKGCFNRLSGTGDSVPQTFYGSVEPSGLEKEFCNSVFNNLDSLMYCLDIHTKSTVFSEFSLEPYGRSDFLIQHDRIWTIVEVKMGEAPISVVSQIDKYRLAAELEMCVGTHDEVECYVAAEGFGTYVASELSRISVHMIEHRGKPDFFRKIS